MTDFEPKIIRLPLLALRGLNVLPGMLLTFDVERPVSVAALDQAKRREQLLFLSAQKDLTEELPEADEDPR